MVSSENHGIARRSPQPSVFARACHQLAVPLLLAMGALAPPTLIASELQAQKLPVSTGQIAPQIWLLEPIGLAAKRSQFKSQARRHLLRVQREAKIRAQTRYLAAKFRQSESNIRTYVELAWKEAGKRNGVAPELLIAMMQKESSLRPTVQSDYGAQGLMQVVRRWHHEKLHPSESLFDPAVNIRVGAVVLEEYLEKANGSLSKALKKYSGNARGYARNVLTESFKLARVSAEAVDDILTSDSIQNRAFASN